MTDELSPNATSHRTPTWVWIIMGVIMVAVVVVYTALFPAEPDFDPVDSTREVAFFLGSFAIYIYASRANVRLFDVGFAFFLLSLWMEVVDEFTYEPRWVGTGIPGPIGVVGLVLIAAAARQWSLRRREDHAARARAEDELRRSHSTLQAVVEGTPDPVWVKDVDGRYMLVNSAFTRMVGMGTAAIVGRREVEVLPREVALKAGRSDQRALEEGETVRFEDTLAITGPPRTYLISKTVFRDLLGNPVGILGIARDITERKAAEDRLAHQALHDPLTALPNRAAFLQRLVRAVGRWQHQPDRRFAVLFLDVDRFKEINDRFGHAVGDEFLVAFAERLSLLLRPGDVVSRLGGDEFTVLLDQVSSVADAALIAERVLEGFRSGFVLTVGRVDASASIGVALCSPATATADQLLKAADGAMYRAKELGRAQLVVAES
jgi:diguanylate cyclase (GGDEF)-like protein/PAS domain S-box-containing protein